MKYKIFLVLILGVFLTTQISSLSIIAGNNYTFSLDTTDNLFWSVVNNHSNMDGFEVYQDIYDDYSNITFVVDYRFAPDNFTLALFNQQEKIIKEYHYRGGGTRTIIKNQTVEVPTYLDRAVYINNCSNISQIENPKQYKPTTKDKVDLLIIIIFILFISYMVIKSIILSMVIKSKKEKAIKLEGEIKDE